MEITFAELLKPRLIRGGHSSFEGLSSRR
jgi:hypothetical protein